MELYVLNNNFLPVYVIDNFVSVIWTERYTSAGDVQLTLVPTKFYIESLKPGTYLSIPESQEVMRIETQLIENGLLKISGHSLLDFLSQRYVWEAHLENMAANTSPILKDYTSNQLVPGNFISAVVERFTLIIPEFPNAWKFHSLDSIYERIPNFSLGAIDYSGAPVELTAKLGPIYPAIKEVAETHKVGISLYLEYANNNGAYSLKFQTYKGKNRTSNQSTNKLIRLSPSFDEISDVKELQSSAEEINTIYVHNPGGMYRFEIVNGMLVRNGVSTPGLHRRTKVVHPTISPNDFGSSGISYNYMFETAQRYLAKYKQAHIIDAQITSLNNYIFGVDYWLGDIVDFESAITAARTPARVTEYIRSHDSTGEKAYPTIVVE
jgi:hypothetical protein